MYGIIPTLHLSKVVLQKPNAVIKYTLLVILVKLNFALRRNFVNQRLIRKLLQCFKNRFFLLDKQKNRLAETRKDREEN